MRIAFQETLGVIPKVDPSNSTLPAAGQINLPAFSTFGNVVPDIDRLWHPVFIGDDQALQVQRGTGHFKLDPAEIVEGATDQDPIVVCPESGLRRPDDPPASGGTSARRRHSLIVQRRAPNHYKDRHCRSQCPHFNFCVEPDVIHVHFLSPLHHRSCVVSIRLLIR